MDKTLLKRLVQRHPVLFESIAKEMKPNKPHQFQDAIDRKSKEFTGKLYTKSESKTEELIEMMAEVQLENVHTVSDGEGITCCEKKIVSGDNKTEKNMHYGILSKTDEVSEMDRLSFILPSHEYFHQKMVVADCITELFRDPSRGLEGGYHFIATMLQRHEAKNSKGKEAIDDLEDFLILNADARFCQFFLQKYNYDPTVDNTPLMMKRARMSDKISFLHKKVEAALRDLLPYFRKSHQNFLVSIYKHCLNRCQIGHGTH